jgi:hypothetical protein
VSRTHQLLCAWCGPLFVLLFGVGFWVFAEYLPPHRPSASAEEIAAIYQANASMIRVGMLFLLTGAGVSFGFVAAISAQLRRIETGPPVLSDLQLIAGVSAALLLLLPAMIFTMAAFRPERAPELTQLLSDAAWLLLIMPFPPACMQLIAIALAIFADRGVVPVFPRWAAFFNLWAAVLFIPGGLASFFKTGPFAWNGLFAFWLAAAAFFAWIIVMSVLLIRTIRAQPA